VPIREASTADAERLAELIREGFRDVAERFGLTRENCPKHPSQCEASWVSSAMARGVRYFVDESPVELRGCVAVERVAEGVGYLERLAVLPDHRRDGLGTALVNHSEEHARAEGIRRLEVGVIAGQGELVAWYGRRGFALFRTARFAHLPFEVAFLGKGL
jgi:N-acetylglutamate synthase-like GNAT family acetyltransferase